MKKNNLLFSLSILATTGLLVKVLGMLNKIIITRVLGVEGVSMFSLLMPTAMLFLTICSFSLSISIQNNVSKNISKQIYSNRDLVIKGFITTTLLCCVVSLITLIFNYHIASYLLKMAELEIPFLFFIPMYFFASWGGVLKGYLHGHNKLNVYAFAQAFEQVIRIISSIIIFMLADSLTLNTILILVVLSFGIGEVFQFTFLVIYCLFFTKISNKTRIKHKYSSFVKTSLTLTLNRIVSSISYFIEPIVFTHAILLVGLKSEVATEAFGIFYGYVMPIILTGTFVTSAIQQATMPSLAMNKDNHLFVKKTLRISLFVSFIFGLILLYILLFHSFEILDFVYSETSGSIYLTIMGLSAFLSYFDGIFSAIFIVFNYEKKLLIFHIVTSFVKLILLFSFVKIPFLTMYSLPIAHCFISIISFIYFLKVTLKITNYKLKLHSILQSILCLISTILLGYILGNYFNWLASTSIVITLIILSAIAYYHLHLRHQHEKS